MILQKLRIENFKRLHDVEIVFPSIGIIGVVGANGAGKSTLFEAILWALFRPNAVGIDNRDVVPRRSVGATTKVELTLETDDTVYTISRSLRITAGGSQRVEASVFKGDDAEPLVTGANQVSDFVRGTLLRMSSQSFTTTFFTRQKELAFFGEMGDTERRREMQRLLDMDAIERAQAKLREERNRERAALTARTAQLGEENAARDLDAELAAAQQAEADVDARVARLTNEHARLSAEYDRLATRMESLRATQRQSETLQAERRAAETAQMAAQATHDDATRRIALLHDRRRRAAEIAPVLASLPTVEVALRDADAGAAHAQRVAEGTRDVREAENAVAQLYAATDAMIADLDALRDLLFDWETLDDEPPGLTRARALAGQLAAAAPMTVERVKERDALRALMRRADDATRAAEDARGRTGKRAELHARLAVIVAGHDPAARVDQLEREERALTEDVARLETELTALRAEHGRYATLMKRWEGTDPDAECPTCGRPFTDADSDIMFASLRRSMESCAVAGKEVGARLDAVRGEGRSVSGALQQERERLRQAQTIAAQRDRAVIEERDATDRATQVQAALAEALAAAHRRHAPAEKDIAHLESEIALLERAANAVGPASRLVTQMEHGEDRLAALRDALYALGVATYDGAHHEHLRQERARLIALQSEAARIDEELRALPAEEERRETAARWIATAADTVTRVTTELAALAFDPESLVSAEQEASAAADAANMVQGELTATMIAAANARNVVERVVAEQTRLAVLKASVDRLAASVAQFNLMDEGFTDFSVALAARIQPRLGEYASDLIERMSNGRYNRLTFDTNYAPALYDGDLEKFPVDKFSGGERDIAALAARIALSQLLAARGGHAIGFMVLDEVFGSLDNERRTLVLDALAAMRDIIPQLFIISHVDDVRLSPLMDEVWTVAAQPEGTSAVLRRDAADLLLGAAIAAM